MIKLWGSFAIYWKTYDLENVKLTEDTWCKPKEAIFAVISFKKVLRITCF